MSSRKTCSECKSTKVRHDEDRTQVVYYAGDQAIYKKVWHCINCGHNFN